MIKQFTESSHHSQPSKLLFVKCILKKRTLVV